MKEMILQLEKRFNAFSMRERLLIGIALLVIIYMSWYTTLYDYILATDEEISRKARQIKEQISSLEGQIDTISEVLGRNPTYVLAQQARDLKKENEVLDQKIYDNTKRMVSSSEMTKMLSDLLNKAQGLTVISMESLETKALFPPKTLQQDGKIMQFQVFNHGLRVEMMGNYFDVLRFLKTLERESMRVIWDEISYEVKKYPKAKIILILHTLSLEEGWIGA